MELDAYRNMAATENEHWWFCGRRAIGEAVIRGLNLPKGAKILEIGAGTGGNISMLERFGEVQAVEMSDLARRIAWEKTGRDFLYGLVIVAKTLVFGIDVPGYASLLVSILFLGGIQLLGIGIIGQYLGRVYAEIKQRPIYIVRQTFEGK